MYSGAYAVDSTYFLPPRFVFLLLLEVAMPLIHPLKLLLAVKLLNMWPAWPWIIFNLLRNLENN